MYPWYQQKPMVALDEDHKNAIQALYVFKQRWAPIPTSTTTTTIRTTLPTTTSTIKTTTSTESPNESRYVSHNLCDVKYPDVMFLAYAPKFPNYKFM